MILLGKKDEALHYMTLVGYTKIGEEFRFHVYDSWHTKGEGGLTADDNAALPGNRTLTSDELMNFWREGGLFGMYQWYALVVWDKIEN